MRTETIIIDDFYPDPMKVRNYALSIKWGSPFAAVEKTAPPGALPPDDGTWKTSDNDYIENTVFHREKMIRVLETITGDEIDRDTWFNRPAPWNGQIHVKNLDDSPVLQPGQFNRNGIHNHVHDPYNNTGKDGWAAIVFLRPQEVTSGMFTWRPKGKVSDNPWKMDNDPEQFQPMDSIANKFNRLIIGRGDLWHSGADGIGSTLEDGRMFQTFFFRTLGPLKEMRRETLSVEDLPEPLTKSHPMVDL